ncbi:MAG: hypothetical protein F6J93_27250 [Oscillatoria sp. SIO1A7]|nr:hypothetical protein [Oscillatoria sp. SIO1A7]
MVKVSGVERDVARVLQITEKLIEGDSLYRERLNRDEMTGHIVKLFSELSAEELSSVSEENLQTRIDGILVTHAVAGTLNELSAEQMEVFDAAVEGR